MEEKEKWVIIDADGIDILIATNDPWYSDLTEKYPNQRPYTKEGELEPDSNYEDLDTI